MFVNTIIAGQTVGVGAVDQPVKLVNTLWHGNGTNTSDNLNAILTQGDVTGDPAFVGPAAGDYHIGSASAARDRGIDIGVRTDIDGQARPDGAGYDIGADEYLSGPAATATPTRTATPTATLTRTPTATLTRTPTATLTRTPSATTSVTATKTLTRTRTPTATRTATVGPEQRRIYLPLVLRR